MLTAILAFSGIMLMFGVSIYEIFKIIDQHEKDMLELDNKIKHIYNRTVHKDLVMTRARNKARDRLKGLGD